MYNTGLIFEADSQSLWQTAAALECVHVYSLIHDDLPCMDDDDIRRGRPTVHKAFDEAIAVLSGDALLTEAFKIIAQTELAPDKKVRLISGLAKAAGIRGMIGGQVLDIKALEQEQTLETISNLQNLKTGALIKFAVSAGAIIGGAALENRAILENYAEDLGLLFQLTDDILDETGDAVVMGKAAGKDRNLGKATFVSILGLEGAKEKATILAGRAKGRLEPLGQKAQILSDTVDYVSNRTH